MTMPTGREDMAKDQDLLPRIVSADELKSKETPQLLLWFMQLCTSDVYATDVKRQIQTANMKLVWAELSARIPPREPDPRRRTPSGTPMPARIEIPTPKDPPGAPPRITGASQQSVLIGWPDDKPPRYNGSSTPCDMWTGPCSCGAWHYDGK